MEMHKTFTSGKFSVTIIMSGEAKPNPNDMLKVIAEVRKDLNMFENETRKSLTPNSKR
jgi:hypothetical protein